jgi:hypothetical protein
MTRGEAQRVSAVPQDLPSEEGFQMTPLRVIAFVKAKDGKREELGRRLIALVDPSRTEAGCINLTRSGIGTIRARG